MVWYGEQVLEANGAPRLLKESFVLVRLADPAQTDPTLTNAGWTVEERRVIEIAAAVRAMSAAPRCPDRVELRPYRGCAGRGDASVSQFLLLLKPHMLDPAAGADALSSLAARRRSPPPGGWAASSRPEPLLSPVVSHVLDAMSVSCYPSLTPRSRGAG